VGEVYLSYENMASRLYRPKRDDRVHVGQDVLREHAHNIATEQLIPRIAVENQIAVETVVTNIYFYSRLPKGRSRRCSCFDIEVSPNSACRCCWGTGQVGGYQKYGTHTEVVDVTHPSIRAMNVIVDYDRRSRPRQFVLMPGATSGFLVSRMDIKTNVGTIDHIFALTDKPGGTDINAFLKAPSDQDYVEFTETALKQRLFNPWVDIKITLNRPSVAAESPRFAMLYIRYDRLEDYVIKANIPRTRKANMLQEFGSYDDWQEQNFYLDNTITAITTEDWIAKVNDGTRWRINGVTDFAPQDLLTSWDINTTIFQKYEPATYFPL